MFGRLFSVVLVALATIPLWGANENTLTAESLVLPIGTTEAKLTVSLTNEAAISDIQFDLYLPTGFSVAYDEDDEARIEVNTTRTTAKRHSVDYLEKTGFTRIMCTSSKGYTFSGNSGPVVDIYIIKDANVSSGTYNVFLKNIAISNSENTYTPADATSQITVSSVTYHNIIYRVDGEIYETETYAEGASITPIAAPTKEGYTFSGWDSVPSTMPEYDVEVNGNFTINQYTVTVKVDGEVFKTLTQDYGSTISIPAAPTKEGYSFSGWQNVVKTVPAEDVVYEANFTVNQYTLKFVADGIVVSEKSMDYGSTINIPQAPAKEGYSFMSWGNVAETMPAKNITYTAEYKVNQYKLTYLIDGRVYKTYMIDFGSEITPEDEAEDDDYYYGWEDVPETMPAHDVEVNAYITKVLGWAKSIDKSTNVYTLDGQQVLIPQKGNIYIINGKKVKF